MFLQKLENYNIFSSRDSVEVVADSAAEVKAGERDDKEEVGKDESGQEVEEKVEKTEGEEQKEEEQANVSD